MTTHLTSATSEKSIHCPELDAADVEYFRQRNRDRLYAVVMKVFNTCLESGDITRADVARIINKDPAQITRWFGGPANWTLDTISLLLLACGAEMDYHPVFLSERPRRNDQHDLVYELVDSDTVILRQYGSVNSSVPTRTRSPFRIESLHHG